MRIFRKTHIYTHVHLGVSIFGGIPCWVGLPGNHKENQIFFWGGVAYKTTIPYSYLYDWRRCGVARCYSDSITPGRAIKVGPFAGAMHLLHLPHPSREVLDHLQGLGASGAAFGALGLLGVPRQPKGPTFWEAASGHILQVTFFFVFAILPSGQF